MPFGNIFGRKYQTCPVRLDFLPELRYNIPRMLQKCYRIGISVTDNERKLHFFMIQFRMTAAVLALLAALVCFGCAELDAAETDIAAGSVPVQAPVTVPETVAEEIIEVYAQGSLATPMAARYLDDTPLPLPAEEAAVDEAAEEAAADTPALSYAQRLLDDTAGVADEDALMAAQYLTDRAIDEHMEEAALRAQEIAAAEARERAAEAARRRIEQERRKQLAEEAAKRAACPGYDAEYVASLTEEEQAEAEYFYEQGYVFFRQNWSVTKDAYYGNEGFGQCGCGPTCVAAIISNLAGIPVTPEDMRLYGLEHGSWLADAGTTYDFMITTPAQYGIKATQIYASDKEALYEALADGDKLVLATMGPGDFTLGAHFMLFRGVTEDGKILIADSYSFEYSVMEWDYDDLYAQLKNGYWVYELEESAK